MNMRMLQLLSMLSYFANEMSFLPHLPDKNNDHFYFDLLEDADVGKIAKQNVRLKVIDFYGFPLRVIIAGKILKNSPIGFDYSLLYWAQSKCPPKLLTCDGDCIDEKLYKYRVTGIECLGSIYVISGDTILQQIIKGVRKPSLLDGHDGGAVAASIYQLRLNLVLMNVFPQWFIYLSDDGIEAVGFFIKQFYDLLKEKLGKFKIVIDVYYSRPDLKDPRAVDIVCKDLPSKALKITQKTFENHCSFFKETNELVFTDLEESKVKAAEFQDKITAYKNSSYNS